MPRVICIGAALALTLLAGLKSSVVWSQGAESKQGRIVARSVGTIPERQVVEFVARNAEPMRYDRTKRPDLSASTPRQVIESQCGSLQPGYLAELARSNGRAEAPPLDAPLGEAVFTTRWPACLYARSYADNALTYTVKNNDTLTNIRERFAGAGVFQPKQIDEYFAGSGYTTANANTLKAGEPLPISLTTAATVLQPKMAGAEFVSALNAVGGKSVTSDDQPRSPGDIIGPVRFAGEQASNAPGKFPPCTADDATGSYPFNAQVVEEAYQTTRFDNEKAQLPVSIVVVDNGFFGVPCNGAICPERDADGVKESDRFPKRFFDYNQFVQQEGYGPKLSGSDVEPLNYWNKKDPQSKPFRSPDVNEETGHGTHVAGLVLGGPAFVPKRGVFADGFGKPWLTLVIANLSNGSPKLQLASDRNLDSLLQPILNFKVVNMSVAFDSRVDASIASNVRGALAGDPKSLYVVAAGNSGASLDWDTYELYPARLGGNGPNSAANVITIASIDAPSNGTQRLSKFSNHSAQYVDLAAPGCRISSWIDAEREAVQISGTSQATPLVSFTVTMLQSLWATTPANLKNRVLYSGDLLDAEDDRRVVRSMSQLNIAKTLTYLWTRVTYREAGQSHTRLGKVHMVQGLRCADGQPIASDKLKAVKRGAGGRLAIFRVDNSNNLHSCWGGFDSQATVSFDPKKSIVNGKIAAAVSSASMVIPAADIEEIVLSR